MFFKYEILSMFVSSKIQTVREREEERGRGKEIYRGTERSREIWGTER